MSHKWPIDKQLPKSLDASLASVFRMKLLLDQLALARGRVNSTVRRLIMIRKTLSLIVILISGVVAFAQTKSYESPQNTMRALIVPVGAKGYEAYESRVEIRSSSGALLRLRTFVSPDHNHGEGVGHAEWTADGRFFVFTTSSSGGHQPWHVATYFYSISRNRFYSLDAVVGAIISDFILRDDTLLTTRMGSNLDDQRPVTVSLNRWR
ncbi:MAG TPA: hypothetical protein VHQ95_05195 [Pyrinomonadaceae bacterium]|nr:hypothetical protein [Pyrinomonadaceae bacterium]